MTIVINFEGEIHQTNFSSRQVHQPIYFQFSSDIKMIYILLKMYISIIVSLSCHFKNDMSLCHVMSYKIKTRIIVKTLSSPMELELSILTCYGLHQCLRMYRVKLQKIVHKRG